MDVRPVPSITAALVGFEGLQPNSYRASAATDYSNGCFWRDCSGDVESGLW
jgi:hypothetical protein